MLNTKFVSFLKNKAKSFALFSLMMPTAFFMGNGISQAQVDEAYAQQRNKAGETAPQPSSQESVQRNNTNSTVNQITDYLKTGGPATWVALLLGLSAFTMIISKAFQFKNARNGDTEAIIRALKNKDYSEMEEYVNKAYKQALKEKGLAEKVFSSAENFLKRIINSKYIDSSSETDAIILKCLLEGVKNMPKDFGSKDRLTQTYIKTNILEKMEQPFLKATPILKKYLYYLQGTVITAPLIGVFGTTRGFSNNMDMKDALITMGTAAFIAIFAAFSRSLFDAPIEKISEELNYIKSIFDTDVLSRDIEIK